MATKTKPRKKPTAKRTVARAAAKPKPKAKPKPRRPARHKPEMLRLRGIAPSFTVNDIERSLDFYTRVLGFVLEERWEVEGRLRGGSLKAGTSHLMLGQDDFAKGRDRAKGVGHRIYCTTAQDIDGLATLIKQRGGRLDQEPTDEPWGGRIFSLTDPDGFKITFLREG